MFGLAWLTIPILLAMFTGLLTVVRLIYTMFFSDSAKWKKMNDWLIAKKAQYKAEWDRLRATYRRIDAEPKKTDQSLVDALNEKFKGMRARLKRRSR